MPHEISWYVENRVICASFSGELADDEFSRVGDTLVEFASTGVRPVFLLIDVREVTKMPSSITRVANDLSRFRGQTLHDWTIVLSNNSFFNFIGILATKVVGVPMRPFKTLEEADAFIAHNAPDLAPALLAPETS